MYHDHGSVWTMTVDVYHSDNGLEPWILELTRDFVPITDEGY